ncbi:MAG: Fe-S cluster assembly protein SufD [Polaribacter sp.]|nr:MAG: Fe-S cluster assembly protein SufD [Polaribacter sp.]
MDLKEKIITSYNDFEGQNVSAELQEIRRGALEDFKKLGFPTKKMEAWKYTSLKSVLKEDYNLFPKGDANVKSEDVKKYIIDNIDSHTIVFVDGKFNADLSNLTDEKFVCTLSSALNNSEHKNVIEKHFNKIAKQDNLTSLNTAFASEGAFVHVPKSVTIEKPIQIVYFSTGNTIVQPRNLVVVEQNAHVKIIERHQNLSENSVLTNSVTEIFCDRDATVDYYKIQNDNLQASLVDNTFAEQKSNSECSVHTFSFGGNITRNNLNFYQKGEHMNSILKGVTILAEKQHVDHYTLVHHIEPNCESHQDYKGIYDDKSVGVFNGKVYVEKEAQKTDAYQQNDNILLTDSATINAKPQLEIFADDVKCSHGCTIGQLDDSALFYMQQRGIPKKQANGLLMFAFANTVLESVKIPELQKRITNFIAQKLEVDIEF